MPAVVTIQTGSSRGSGFFVTPDTLLTNVHVVGTNSTVTVGSSRTARRRRRECRARRPAFDIAILKVAGILTNQTVIPLGTAANVRLGEEVIAIGTPLGFLQNTVSRGIVSGVREVGGATLMQTDAAINPGNSGGPLLDRRGIGDRHRHVGIRQQRRTGIRGVGRTRAARSKGVRRQRPLSGAGIHLRCAVAGGHVAGRSAPHRWRSGVRGRDRTTVDAVPTRSTASGSRSSVPAIRAASSARSIATGLRSGTAGRCRASSRRLRPVLQRSPRQATEIRQAVIAERRNRTAGRHLSRHPARCAAEVQARLRGVEIGLKA